MARKRILFKFVLSAVVAGTCATFTTSVSPATPAAPERAGIGFTQIAVPGTAIGEWRRIPSPEHAISDEHRQRPYLTRADFAQEAAHDHGIPGLVIFDYDSDSDNDLFISNGPGRANSLFQSQLAQTGILDYVDVAQTAGVALTDLDANGSCAGDIDNDGDEDLYVMGRGAPNHLMQNQGDGTFVDITASAGDVAGGRYSHISCTMADFNGDGLLEIAIANSFNLSKAYAIWEAWAFNEPTQLFRNVDGHRFIDVSVSSGFAPIRDQNGVPYNPPREELTWSVSAVDYDLDGDADLMTASHQALTQPAKYGGVDRGFLRLFRNDGTGHFQDITLTDAGDLREWGAWSALSFGDFNFDGTLDIFGTNAGEYMKLPLGPSFPHQKADQTSRWMLQLPDGTFHDPRRGSLPVPARDNDDRDPTLSGLNTNPWGWTTSTLDYDNDGFTDILYHGSLSGVNMVTSENYGELYHNEGPQAVRNGIYPTFTRDDAFLRSGTDHRRRTITGVAVGDLDRNGFTDVITVAQSLKVGQLTRYKDDRPDFDFESPLDETAAFLRIYTRDGELFRPTGNYTVEGNLSVELNNGNGNKSATINTLGTAGLVPGGRTNRNGIGAMVFFTPQDGTTAMRPVTAGSSNASQDAHEGIFGMGKANVGTVETLWTGGVRNKLYDVRAGERLTLPEIPCSYTDTSTTFVNYKNCVTTALDNLTATGHVSPQLAHRLFASAIRAFNENR